MSNIDHLNLGYWSGGKIEVFVLSDKFLQFIPLTNIQLDFKTEIYWNPFLLSLSH